MGTPEARGSRRTPLIKSPADINAQVVAYVDRMGNPVFSVERRESMLMPMQCTSCRLIFDAGKVEVTARYSDCSVWKCPGCGRTHDDRPSWSGGAGVRTGCIDLDARDRANAEQRERAGR
jgi:rubredoxin